MELQVNPDNSAEKTRSRFGVRHAQASFLFVAMVLAFTIRINMSVAIVAMTDDTQDGTFSWNMQIQGVILSSFFWGYFVLQSTGDILVARFGGRLLLTLLIATNSIVTLLIPTAAYYGDWQGVCVCRVILGLSQGILFPCMKVLVDKWISFGEKGRLRTFIYSGEEIGIVYELMMAGFISKYWGWTTIFYVNGTVGVIWTMFYLYFGSDSPEKSKTISEIELKHIQDSLKYIQERKGSIIPWNSIWSSLSFLALIVMHCGHSWVFWTLLTQGPSYMSQVAGVDIKTNSIMIATALKMMHLVRYPLAYLSEFLIRKRWLSVNVTRKLFNSIGSFGAAVPLLCLSYVHPDDVVMSVLLLTFTFALMAGHYKGHLLTISDMAPNYIRPLKRLIEFFTNAMYILAPLTAGVILNSQGDTEQWRKVFYQLSGTYIVCNCIFVIFGNSSTQNWTDSKSNEIEKSAEKSQERGKQVP